MLTLTTGKIAEIFVDCDDFMIEFSAHTSGVILGSQAYPESALSVSETVTLCILYHHSRMDCFKTYYELVVLGALKNYFPDAPSYTHFIKLKKHCVLELFCFLLHSRMSPPTPDANFVDAKKLTSCHIRRERQHKTMKGLAAKGKTSTGWFFGLKIHLIVNEFGQPCNFLITSGNRSDNNTKVLKQLFKGMKGIFFGDKGYLTKLRDWLSSQGVKLITKVKKNMKKPPLTHKQKHYLKRRSLIETVFGLMTYQCDIDHTRHRSQSGFFINVFSALAAYTYIDSIPNLKRFSRKEIEENEIVLIQE